MVGQEPRQANRYKSRIEAFSTGDLISFKKNVDIDISLG